MKKNISFGIEHFNFIISYGVIVYLIFIVGIEMPDQFLFSILVSEERISRVLFMTLPVLIIYIIYITLVLKRLRRFFTINLGIIVITLFLFTLVLLTIIRSVFIAVIPLLFLIFVFPVMFLTSVSLGIKKDRELYKKNRKITRTQKIKNKKNS